MPVPANCRIAATACTWTMCRKTSASTAARGLQPEGLQHTRWDTSRIDLVSDVTAIAVPDTSFDAVLCSEVLERVPEPSHAFIAFGRLVKPSGVPLAKASAACLNSATTSSGQCHFLFERFIGASTRPIGSRRSVTRCVSRRATLS
ncbi:MAG: class I SAM-dependent methyltransferase [Gammaproteobacteria bacterium]|nr:class I SAM-dependent methyltransferase [Gammaproteobacteria bacterium]